MSGIKQENFSDDVSNFELLDRAKKEFIRDRNLLIKSLPAEISEEEIKAYLEDYVLKDVTINKQQNQALVTMLDGESVLEAVSKLKDSTLLYTQVTMRVGDCDNMLCVAQLPLSLTEWMFRDAMAVHGTINKCFLMRSEQTGESKGYGFIEYSEPLEKISQIKTKLDWSVIEQNTVHCDAVIDRTAHGLMFEDLHSKCLLINNLPLDYKDPIELRNLFSSIHKPVYCQIVLKEGESLGFGIIEYAEAEEAEDAFKAFSDHKIDGTVINLSYCIPGMSAVHMFNRIMFKYGDKVKVNKASLHSDPVYPNPAFLKHNFFKLLVTKFPRLLVNFTDNLLQLQQGYVHQLETHTNAKPGILGPAPNIPMSPLMDIHLQLGLLSLVVLDLKERKQLEGEIPDPLGKLKVPTQDETSTKSELPSLLGDPMTAQADIVLKNIISPANDTPDFPPLEKTEEPCLLGRPMRKLSLACVQSLGRLMAMLTESKGLLGNAPVMGGQPRPLMENLIMGGMGLSSSKDGQGPKSLLGEIPGHGNTAAANFMGAVKALAFQKLTESPAHNKNQILNALFGNQGNNNEKSDRDGSQSLLGKPPPLMSLGLGKGGGMGDGLLPEPGQGNNFRNDNDDYGGENYGGGTYGGGNYGGGYGDQGFQRDQNRNYNNDSFNDCFDRGYGGTGYGGANKNFGMDQGFGSSDSGSYGNSGGYYGDGGGGFGGQGMNYGSKGGATGGGSFGEMGAKPLMQTPNRKKKTKEYGSIAKQAAAYAASLSSSYNQYENYMSGYAGGYSNNSNDNSGYNDEYDSGYNNSGYSGQGWNSGNSGSSYGSYTGGSEGGQGYNNNSSNMGYGRVGGGGSADSGSYGGSQGYGGSSGYGGGNSGYDSGSGYGRGGSGGGYGGMGSMMMGSGYAGPGSMGPPPVPQAPRQSLMGTPQGQKRNSNHFVPSPEPSPEGDYIGQHSQGLGGHYADTYGKRQKLHSRFGVY